MAIEDIVGNKDDDDRSIKGVGFLQAKGRYNLSGYLQQLQPNVH
jgi:hypothetical protein